MQNSGGLPTGNNYQGIMGPAVTYSNQYENQMQANNYHYQQPQQYRPPVHHYNNNTAAGSGYQYYANQDHQYGAGYPERQPKPWQSANGPRPYRNPWMQPPSPLHSLQKMVLQDGGMPTEMGYFPSSDPASDGSNPAYSAYYSKNKLCSSSPNYTQVSSIPAAPSIEDIIQPITSDHFPPKQEASAPLVNSPSFPNEKLPDTFGPPRGDARFQSSEKETAKESINMHNCSFDRKDSQHEVPEACPEKNVASESQAPKLNHLPLNYNSPSAGDAHLKASQAPLGHDNYTNFESLSPSSETIHNPASINPSCKVNVAPTTEAAPILPSNPMLQPTCNVVTQSYTSLNTINVTSANLQQPYSRMMPTQACNATQACNLPNAAKGQTYSVANTTMPQPYSNPTQQPTFTTKTQSTLQTCIPSNALHTFNLPSPNIPQSRPPVNTAAPPQAYCSANSVNSANAATIPQVGKASGGTIDLANYTNNVAQPFSPNFQTPNAENISQKRLAIDPRTVQKYMPPNCNMLQTSSSCNPSNVALNVSGATNPLPGSPSTPPTFEKAVDPTVKMSQQSPDMPPASNPTDQPELCTSKNHQALRVAADTVSSTPDQAFFSNEDKHQTPSTNLHIVRVTAQANNPGTPAPPGADSIKSPGGGQPEDTAGLNKSSTVHSPLIIEVRSMAKLPEATSETEGHSDLTTRSQPAVDSVQNKGPPCIINVNRNSSPIDDPVNIEASHSDQVSPSSCSKTNCDISKDSIAHDNSCVKQEASVENEGLEKDKGISKDESDGSQEPIKSQMLSNEDDASPSEQGGTLHKGQTAEQTNALEDSIHPIKLEINGPPTSPLPIQSDIKLELDSEDSLNPKVSQPRKKKVTKKVPAKTKRISKGKQRKPPALPSKNTKQPLKKRGSKQVVPVETEVAPPKTKKQRFSGPYIHVEGSRQKPTSISVVNLSSKEKDEVKPDKPAKSGLDKTPDRRGRGVIHTSTLSPNYDAVTRDRTWLCSFCHQGSHFQTLGDLYGPYYTEEDSKLMPSTIKLEPKSPPRVIRSKRKRSELVEEFFNKSKKCKQQQQPAPPQPARKSVSIQTDQPSPPSKLSVELWVHEECAYWTPGIFLSGPRIHGLAEAVSEATAQNCTKCKQNGATLACVTRGCKEAYHYPCALLGCEMSALNFTIHCPKHKHPGHLAGPR